MSKSKRVKRRKPESLIKATTKHKARREIPMSNIRRVNVCGVQNEKKRKEKKKASRPSAARLKLFFAKRKVYKVNKTRK